jgi:hypothetical protein
MQTKVDTRLRALWQPLPIEHAGVQVWIRHVYQHMAHCYRDEGALEYGRPATLIFPVPDYKLRRFVDDVRFSNEWRALEHQKIDQENREIRERAAAIAIPANHQAVRWIQKFYPAHDPRVDLIEEPPKGAHITLVSGGTAPAYTR